MIQLKGVKNCFFSIEFIRRLGRYRETNNIRRFIGIITTTSDLWETRTIEFRILDRQLYIFLEYTYIFVMVLTL